MKINVNLVFKTIIWNKTINAIQYNYKYKIAFTINKLINAFNVKIIIIFTIIVVIKGQSIFVLFMIL